MKIDEIYDAVLELNGCINTDNIPDSINGGQFCFTLGSTGYSNWIKFGEQLLWNDDDDERLFDEDKGRYVESLKDFCLRKLNDYSQVLDKAVLNKNGRLLNWIDKRISITKTEIEKTTELNLKIAKGGKLTAYKQIKNYIETRK